MIQLATWEMKQELASIWKQVFCDNDQYIDLIFSGKFSPEHTLVGISEGKIVATLHMQPYTFSFWNTPIPCYYLAGLATLPPFRNQGWMGRLITYCHQVMNYRNIPLSLLVPAEESLRGYYQRYNYTPISTSGKTISPSLKEILQMYDSWEDAFFFFDNTFNNKDFSIRKSYADFLMLIKDAEIDNFPPKTELSAMAYITQPAPLLRIFALHHPHKECYITLQEQTEKQFLSLRNGYVTQEFTPPHITNSNIPHDIIDSRTLTQLLLGYSTQSASPALASVFPSFDVHISYMLE